MKSNLKTQTSSPSNPSGPKNNASTSSASSMADLMKAAKTSLVTFKKGDNIKGLITKLTPSEILVDINAKTEAVVLEKDKKILKRLLALLKEGDSVEVGVLNIESDYGYPVVSLRRYIDNLAFKKLSESKDKKEPIKVTVDIRTGGGYLVSTQDGMQGFLPNSQISFKEGGQDLAGKTIEVFVLEVERASRKIIFSQKTVQDAEEFTKLAKNLKIDQKVDAVITSITAFGLFVNIQVNNESMEGLIHISEISWEKVENLSELFTVGQELEAVVISIDKDAKRADLSIKRLTIDPFEEISKNFVVEQKITGTVLKVIDSGVILELNGAEGFIRKEKIPPTVTFNVGDEITATVSQIDKRRRRIILVPVLLEKPIGYR